VKIAIVSDAWLPQTNGVVRTLYMTVETLRRQGHAVRVIEPGAFSTFPCPTYPEIRLAWRPGRRLEAALLDFSPDAVHIATEGPLGHGARAWCRAREMPFTTSYHTQFPEYLDARFHIGTRIPYAYLRRFHGAARRTMVAAPSMQSALAGHGFRNLVRWGRGVDVGLFRPGPKDLWTQPRPISLYFGRVAVEKNIEALLALDLPGTRVVIGDGPARADLERKYPRVVFTGYKFGDDLARHVAAADVCVFPSRTDTFGLVLLEAMACGLPVAAYPVTGPLDVVRPGVTGVLSEDLRAAVLGALELDPRACRAQALEHTWDAATRQFVANLAPRGASRFEVSGQRVVERLESGQQYPVIVREARDQEESPDREHRSEVLRMLAHPRARLLHGAVRDEAKP
jgi:glycosyltransferase involved in cell wall biosynthesis